MLSKIVTIIILLTSQISSSRQEDVGEEPHINGKPFVTGTNDEGIPVGIIKCPKCYYSDEDWPGFLGDSVVMPPKDVRCKKGYDEIPVDEWEDCGPALPGEANVCMQFNMTMLLENLATQILGSTGDVLENVANGDLEGALGSITDTFSGPEPDISGLTNLFSGGPAPASNLFSGFGRKKRLFNFKIPSFLTSPPPAPRPPPPPSGGSPPISGSPPTTTPPAPPAKSPAPSGIFSSLLSPVTAPLSTIGSKLGEKQWKSKMYWKSCARVNLMETMAGSHCKLFPTFEDIRFFSQQPIIEPLLGVVTGFAEQPLIGMKTNVTGLCMWMDKDFVKGIWSNIFKSNGWAGGQ